MKKTLYRLWHKQLRPFLEKYGKYLLLGMGLGCWVWGIYNQMTFDYEHYNWLSGGVDPAHVLYPLLLAVLFDSVTGYLIFKNQYIRGFFLARIFAITVATLFLGYPIFILSLGFSAFLPYEKTTRKVWICAGILLSMIALGISIGFFSGESIFFQITLFPNFFEVLPLIFIK